MNASRSDNMLSDMGVTRDELRWGCEVWNAARKIVVLRMRLEDEITAHQINDVLDADQVEYIKNLDQALWLQKIWDEALAENAKRDVDAQFARYIEALKPKPPAASQGVTWPLQMISAEADLPLDFGDVTDPYDCD
jgi:hypothetical protein